VRKMTRADVWPSDIPTKWPGKEKVHTMCWYILMIGMYTDDDLQFVKNYMSSSRRVMKLKYQRLWACYAINRYRKRKQDADIHQRG
jgi:hypothetical protein